MAAESAGEDRTAVVIVHGMGEKRPMEILDDFAKTALRPRSAEGEKIWDYYSLPADITGSYEARRFASAQADIYEYHWSFLMTANKYAGAMPMALRLVLRRASNVPDAPTRDLARRVDRGSGDPPGDPRTVRHRLRAQHGRSCVDHRVDHQCRCLGFLVRPVPHVGKGVGEQHHDLPGQRRPLPRPVAALLCGTASH